VFEDLLRLVLGNQALFQERNRSTIPMKTSASSPSATGPRRTQSQTRSASDCACNRSSSPSRRGDRRGAGAIPCASLARQLGLAVPLLAAVGERGQRIEIGTAVIRHALRRNPLYMAEGSGAADLIIGTTAA